MATSSGSLDKLCCIEGSPLQTKNAGMCGEHLELMDHTGLSTSQGSMHLPGPRSAQGSECSILAQSHVGHASCALPRSMLLKLWGALQVHIPRWAVSCALPRSKPLSLSGVPEVYSTMWRPRISSVELVSGCGTPVRYEPSRISGRHF